MEHICATLLSQWQHGIIRELLEHQLDFKSNPIKKLFGKKENRYITKPSHTKCQMNGYRPIFGISHKADLGR